MISTGTGDRMQSLHVQEDFSTNDVFNGIDPGPDPKLTLNTEKIDTWL